MMITSWLLQNFDGLYVLAQTATDAPVATFNPLVSLFSLISYFFSSFCFWRIYEKLGEDNAWFAWVPFLNFWKMYQAGGQSPWWLIGLFIPIVNIAAAVFLIMALINIVKRLGKNAWLILLMLIPLANLWVVYYFAFQ